MSAGTRVRMVAAESVGLAVLWPLMVALQLATFIVGLCDLDAMLLFSIAFASFFFIMHVLLNGSLLRIFWGKIRRPVAVLLFVTFTTPLYLLLLRARHSVAALRGRDQVVARREALKAKYGVSVETSTVVGCPSFSAAVKRTSCVPLCVETSPNDSEVDSEAPLGKWVVTETNVDADTKLIRMGSGDAAAREPMSLSHLFTKDLFELVAGTKTLTYHLVLDANDDIIHVSKTSILAKGLPNQVRGTSPLTVCNDTHYLIQLCRNLWSEGVTVVARNEKSCVTVSQINLSPFIWNNTLYSNALMIYGLLVNLHHNGMASGLYLVSWMCTAAAWLLTHRSVDEPWTDTFAKMPLRLCFTVCRIFLLCAVAMDGLGNVALMYLSAKASGYLALVGEFVYKKLRRNVRLWGDVADRFSFDRTLVRSFQGGESVVCCGWAIWLHVCCPSERSLALLVAVLLCQAAGMIYLNFVDRLLKQPLKNPVRVLMMAKDRLKAAEKSI
nr:uncharacterized protein LOC113816029 [Penaeus vannamei]